jgi:hypothetical protein
LFRYDNNTFIVQNYLPTAVDVTVSIAGNVAEIQELPAGTAIQPAPVTGLGFGNLGASAKNPRTSFSFTVLPHSYMAFIAK